MTPDKKDQKEYIELGPQRGHTKISTSTKKMIVNNFLGGLFWGIGTIFGATIITTLLVIILGKLNAVPIIGDFIGKIIQGVQVSSRP